MDFIKTYFKELLGILFDMAPWLILGFLIAGILHIFFPDGKIKKILGKSNSRSVINAALLGVPLPLCSCGVIPTGVSFYKSGASKGSAVSFLISTPQTGIDSMLVTYSMLGLPFALLRPIIAFVTGLLGGFLTNRVERGEPVVSHSKYNTADNNKHSGNAIMRVLNYSFGIFLMDIAKWLVIGLLVAALIAVFVPDDFFTSHIKSDFLGMLIILAASIPVYVCATSSIPIAAVLMMKGISPGAALVFLMAGPATNAATITVIGKVMGKKTLTVYLASIIAGALFFGLLIDYFLPRDLFLGALHENYMGNEHGLLPEWLKMGSGILLSGLILNGYVNKILKKFNSKKTNIPISIKPIEMNEVKIIVKGMTCSHCKMNVERSIKSVQGVSGSLADLSSGEVVIQGDTLDIDKIKSAVEDIGYTFQGLKN